jgi:hypothetical protein
MKTTRLLVVLVAGSLWSANPLRADQVVMENGDKYNGKVLSLTTNTLVLQSENLGSIALPRARITSILLGPGAAATAPPAAASANPPARPSAPSTTNSVADLPSALRGLRSQTNLIQQVQSQILGSAGPEATGKFNELLDGLSTGKIGLGDLRTEVQTAVNQLRSLKKDVGPDAESEVESYLAILEEFLKETAPLNASTNSSRTAPKPKPENPRKAP